MKRHSAATGAPLAAFFGMKTARTLSNLRAGF
jgi:hypothetical protein